MPPAARVGDMTSHGTPLTPFTPGVMGSPDVLIGGQPAWRAVTDVHVCPQVNGVVPHVGGFVAKGSTTVLINNFPAARQGDVITEGGGGPNGIAMGFLNVQIGG
jgi:uncharacterized Zn-binding protein involved in type VI secretion